MRRYVIVNGFDAERYDFDSMRRYVIVDASDAEIIIWKRLDAELCGLGRFPCGDT